MPLVSFRHYAFATASLLLGGCVLPGDLIDEPTPAPPEFQGVFDYPSEPVVCASPVEGMARFSEESQQRGLVVTGQGGGQPPPRNRDEGDPPQFGTGLAGQALVAQDLDGDGDIDLAAADRAPLVFLNDGAGFFEQAPGLPEAPGGGLMALAAVDLDGDRLPELVGVVRPQDEGSTGGMLIWRNLGFGAWSPPEAISSGQAIPGGEPSSITLGDVDGDGDLDAHFVKRARLPDQMGGWPERIFLSENGVFDAERYIELTAYQGTWGVPALVATFTDRDGDGDQDLFIAGGTPEWGIPPDQPGCAFFRNEGADADGAPVFVDDAEATGTEQFFSAMGIDSADLNQDGDLDYCLTDVGPPVCYLSDGAGGFVDGGLSLGLVPEDPVLDFPTTIGWSIDFQDLDNDGFLDVLQASAPDHGGIWSGTDRFPDLLWRMLPDGNFEDVTEEAAFGSDDRHVGMLSADFDGNGWIDVFFQAESNDGQPLLMMNACGEAHWIELELVGPAGNTEGVGARIEVSSGDRTEIREILTLRATAQTPSRVHVGLGEADIAAEVVVKWPDGVVSRATNLPSDRLVTVVHPDA